MDTDEIKAWLKKNNVTIKKLAEYIHCTPEHLSKVLNGKYPYTYALKARIVDAIKMGVVDYNEKIEETGKWVADDTFNKHGFSLTINFTNFEWALLRRHLPPNLDLENMIKDYLLALERYFSENKVAPNRLKLKMDGEIFWRSNLPKDKSLAEDAEFNTPPAE